MPFADFVSTPAPLFNQGATAVAAKPSGILDGQVIVIGGRSQGIITAPPGLPSGFQFVGPGAFPASDRAQWIAVKPIPVAADETATSYTITGLSPTSSRVVGFIGVINQADLANLVDGGVRYDTDATLPAMTAGGTPVTVFSLYSGEFTAGQSCVPSSIPSGATIVANYQTSGTAIVANSDTTGSRTGIVLLKSTYDSTTAIPSLSVAWPAAPTDPKSAAWIVRGASGPAPTPPKAFTSVSQLLATKNATALHRAPAGVAPSCLDTINKGFAANFSVFEMSVAWTSNNTPFLLGDRYLDPTALNNQAGTTLDPQTMTWAQVQSQQIVIGSNAPQPYMLLVDALVAVVDSGKGLALVDPKFGAGDLTKINIMLDICDAHGGPSKIIIKFDSPITGADLVNAAKARGYQTMNYWGTEIEKLTLAYHTDKWDIIGAKYDADAAMWNATKAIGKKTWAAIVPNQAALNTAVPFTGADLYMVQSLAITPVGPSAVDPGSYASQSNSALELAWLRKVSGSSALASLSDLRKAVFGSSERDYWAARSGLSSGSLSDHRLTAMRLETGASGSSSDVARAFYAQYSQ